jgi:hypothetical protein
VGKVYELLLVSPQPDATLKYELSGRFAVHDRMVIVLLDRHGHLQELDGPLTPRKQAVIDALSRAAYYSLVQTTEVWTQTTTDSSDFEPGRGGA